MTELIKKIINIMDCDFDQSGYKNYKYDIMSDAVIWGDEVREFPIHQLNLMREVWSYRSGIYLGEDRVRFKDTWMQFQKIYPHWIGFDAERINPGYEVVDFFRNSRRREQRRMERYEKLNNGDWFPLTGRKRDK